MKEAHILTQNDKYLIARLAKAAQDLAERCGVDGASAPAKPKRRAKKKPAPEPAAAPTRPVPRAPIPRRPVAVNEPDF